MTPERAEYVQRAMERSVTRFVREQAREHDISSEVATALLRMAMAGADFRVWSQIEMDPDEDGDLPLAARH